MRSSWHRTVLNGLLLFGCYYSIVIGTLSSVVDYRKQCITSKKWYTICAYISNVIILASSPVLAQFKNSWELPLQLNFEQNWVILHADRSMVVTRLLLVVLIIVFRRKRERVFLKLTSWIFKLDAHFVRSWSPTSNAAHRRLDLIHLLKFGTMVIQTVFMFVSSLCLAQQWNWQLVAKTFYVASVLNVIHSTFFQYFTVLMCLLFRFENLNLQLESLYYSLNRREVLCVLNFRDTINSSRQLRLFSVSDLKSLAAEHYHVTALSRYLSIYLKSITLGVLLWNTLQNIVFGIYIFFALDSKEFSTPRNWYAIGSVAALYAVLYLDLYLFYWSCEAISSAHRRTAQLLQLFNNLSLSESAKRQLDTFALQLTTQPLYIGASGIYRLSNASYLSLCVYILRTILILLQFEFERRLKLLRQQLEVEISADIDGFILEYEQ